MANGAIVAEGTPESLGGRETSATVITFQSTGSSLEGLPVDGAVIAENGRVTATSDSPTRTVHEITGWAIERGIELIDLTISRPSLEDVYIQLTEDASDV